MRTAVITIASGRHHHLACQRIGLLAGQLLPDLHVLVAMDDPDLPGDANQVALTTVVEQVAVRNGRLPLARARNVGAAAAIKQGADVLIFLDVDCIPGPRLVQRYLQVAGAHQHQLLCGPVSYLPPRPAHGYRLADLATLATPHPARPIPPEHGLLPAGDPRLFWALSFAISRSCWSALGGFCEDYEGYGAEDTDFAQLAARRGVSLTWVGGAWAYHQHHGSQDPPVQHLRAIIRNASIFRQRWGWWPMQGWPSQFQRLGLADYDPIADRWYAIPKAGRSPRD